MSSFLISVIVSTYNRPDALVTVLKALKDQGENNYEIIVADDGSGPQTKEAIQKEAFQSSIRIIHVWHEDQGFRLAAIRNKAIIESKGEYLVFLDGDCIVQRDFLAQHRALSQIGKVVTGSRILLSKHLTEEIIGGLLIRPKKIGFWIKRRIAGDINKIFPIFIKIPGMRFRDVSKFEWKSIKGCNIGAWKKDVKLVNGFDARFNGWGHEDVDFVARLYNAGVARKKGFLATEVLHLWHPEAPRDKENKNKIQVLMTLQNGDTLSKIGINEYE